MTYTDTHTSRTHACIKTNKQTHTHTRTSGNAGQAKSPPKRHPENNLPRKRAPIGSKPYRQILLAFEVCSHFPSAFISLCPPDLPLLTASIPSLLLFIVDVKFLLLVAVSLCGLLFCLAKIYFILLIFLSWCPASQKHTTYISPSFSPWLFLVVVFIVFFFAFCHHALSLWSPMVWHTFTISIAKQKIFALYAMTMNKKERKAHWTSAPPR